MESGRQRKSNGMDQFMDVFNSQVARLEMLWQDQGLYQPEGDSLLPPDWALKKLSPVLKYMQELVDQEKDARDHIYLEIDELQHKVESLCKVLGRIPDEYLGQEFGSVFLTLRKLKATVKLLEEEIEARIKQANDTSKAAFDISFELKIKPKRTNVQNLQADIGPEVLTPILNDYDQLYLKRNQQIDMFDVAVSRIHFKWKSLSLEPEKKNAIESQLDTLFENLPPAREDPSRQVGAVVFPHEAPVYSWYANMPKGLSALNLSMDILTLLLDNARISSDSENKPVHRAEVKKKLQRLYGLADMDASSMKQTVGCPDVTTLKKIKAHCDEMETYVSEHIHELTELHNGKLEEMWTLCHVADDTKAMFQADQEALPTFMERLESVYDEHVHLKFQFDNAPDIFSKIRRRKYIIDKLREFETNHSSKDRFRGSSLMLLKEEKFRKTEYPQLVELENSLLDLVNKYEARMGQPFIYERGKFKLILSKSIERRKGNLEIIGLKDSMSTESFTKRTKSKPNHQEPCTFCQTQARRATSRAASRATSRATSRGTPSRGTLSKEPAYINATSNQGLGCTCGINQASPSLSDRSVLASPNGHLSKSPVPSPNRSKLSGHYSTSPPTPPKAIRITRHSTTNLSSISSCLSPIKSATASQTIAASRSHQKMTPLASKVKP